MVAVMLDQHHTLREETLLSGQEMVPAGRKQPHFQVLDFRLGTIQEGKKMSDSERWTRQVI